VIRKVLSHISRERLQYLVFIGLSLGAAGLTGAMQSINRQVFRPYFGSLNPLASVLLISLLGVVLFSFLTSQGWFAIYKKHNLRGLLFSFSLGALFSLPTIFLDNKVIFPRNLNVLFPQSLLFYPAIGYVVEIVFHILPLSLFLFVLTSLFKKADQRKVIWICILMVSISEPIYQTIGFVGRYPMWAIVYVWIHLFLFSLTQLLIFRRFDFTSMYSFRLGYYLIWHIIWGYVRLKLLF
jgi:hypothetical protein